jgi:hypothetical protein
MALGKIVRFVERYSGQMFIMLVWVEANWPECRV